MQPEYASLYEQNHDLIGWLTIDDTVIDYPVMQTPENENYYLYLDFYKEKNENGSLIMDTDSQVGVGKAKEKYCDGTAPSTNLIIHGHTMKSGQMFGSLDLYKDKEYGMEHKIIRFDSLYDTGVTAKFGDEFITLSACSYHVEDGRFVVVGKRK